MPRARRAAPLVLVVAAALVTVAGAPPPARAEAGAPSASQQEELLRGVRAFRAERYDEALAIFRGLQGRGAGAPPELSFDLGNALHKLGRHGEALGEFRAAARAGLREPVAEYYRAVSCYRLGLLSRARLDFTALLLPPGASTVEAGPRLREGARRFLSHIEGLLAQHAPEARFAAVLAAAEAAPGEEALEWLEEAALLMPQQRDRAAAATRLKAALVSASAALPPAEVLALSRRIGP